MAINIDQSGKNGSNSANFPNIYARLVIGLILTRCFDPMDSSDQQLVSALRRNARASISDLADQLQMSRATVRTRLQRLMASGEILGFTVVVEGEGRHLPTRGITLIEIEGSQTERIVRELQGMPEVQEIHTTNGRWDLIVEVGTKSLPALDSVLRRIRLINGVTKSETSLYLSTR